ncbi:hypothetical protein JCM19236_5798 [Vibrio sp. JCM 19236]|nr:hypothetical protein JCM19236_5798 [Vibrio sp. JCM 19236]
MLLANSGLWLLTAVAVLSSLLILIGIKAQFLNLDSPQGYSSVARLWFWLWQAQRWAF